MTRKETRTLIFTEVKKFNTNLASVYYENLEGPTSKPLTWIRASLRFATSSMTALGEKTNAGILFVQIFHTLDTGSSNKDAIIDELNNLFEYKTLNNTSGIIQFESGREAIAPNDGGYIQTLFDIPFTNIQEI